MKNNILNINDITCIDLDISNICNLRCKLCPSILINSNKFIRHFGDIDLLFNRISKFKSLKTIQIAGAASEPTLHPKLFLFLDKLNTLNLYINIFSNGSTNNVLYWSELAKHLNCKSSVIFTICGTTLELHEKYRCGSNLKQLLENILAFKKSSKYNNDYILYIRFEYNKHESDDLIKKFTKQFSNLLIIDTDSVYERFNINKFNKNDGICSDIKFSILYRQQLKRLLLNRNNLHISCNSFDSKVVQMDPFGKIYPCVAYRIFSQNIFENNDTLNYNNILNNKCDFCFECDKNNLKFLEKYGKDPFYICDNK